MVRKSKGVVMMRTILTMTLELISLRMMVMKSDNAKLRRKKPKRPLGLIYSRMQRAFELGPSRE